MYRLANAVFRLIWHIHNPFDRYTLAMVYMVLGLAVFTLAGCSRIHYAENGAEFERISFGAETQIDEFSVSRDPSGRIVFGMRGYQSDQVKAIGAVAEGVAKGLGEAVKP